MVYDTSLGKWNTNSLNVKAWACSQPFAQEMWEGVCAFLQSRRVWGKATFPQNFSGSFAGMWNLEIQLPRDKMRHRENGRVTRWRVTWWWVKWPGHQTLKFITSQVLALGDSIIKSFWVWHSLIFSWITQNIIYLSTMNIETIFF